ncbi:MAG: hypothetical protein JWN36_3068 [Microbacteriaceae bacterium]|nr:hypothetical protein [Microbacteriaceae bacterium]
MEKPGYITPPPGLIPPAPSTEPTTAPMPERDRGIPTFVPTPLGAPVRAATQWSLTLHDGSIVQLAGTMLLGRDPARLPGWESAALVKLNDPDKTVSKTHAAVDTRDGGLTVVDLESTNGVAVIAPGGAKVALDPGAAHVVESGSTILFGSYAVVAAAR